MAQHVSWLEILELCLFSCLSHGILLVNSELLTDLKNK